ncbi:MAG: pseudaminic acid cytidylyltransferase [Lachnospiraceae bacterium]|nr:pseudaminic acid cytidylyltransferase [Lachnospiraceae bacterium]
MKRIAIITARGGSKRIPKKNIKEFFGKPIIAYTIVAAKNSGLFDEVMVSTDSEEIAEVARNYGANVPFMRSEKTSNDFATTRDVLLEVLNEYHKRGKEFDTMCCLYPTAPFINDKNLIEAYDEFEKRQAKMLVPVVKFSYPPQRAYVISDGELKFKWEEYRNSRSQDLEPFYHDIGQFYIYDVKTYLENDGIIKENVAAYIVPETIVQDIDNLDDWKVAEMKYQILNSEN